MHQDSTARTLQAEGRKKCSRCKQELPHAAFAKCRTKWDGLDDRCRQCKADAYQQNKHRHTEREREYARANSERIAARATAWNKANPERRSAISRRYYEQHQEEIQEYRKQNREHLHALTRTWKQAHRKQINEGERRRRVVNIVQERLRLREKESRRRAQMRATASVRVDYAAILQRDGLWCHICSCAVCPADVHFDHVIPLARGGTHTENNIRIAHATCNLSKGAKMP